jgi:hypothetical protein
MQSKSSPSTRCPWFNKLTATAESFNFKKKIKDRRCLTTYMGSSATQAMCASWQASIIVDMLDLLI